MRLPPILVYVLRRLAIGLVVLFGISAVAFSMAYLLPSDPVTSRYPDITNEQRAEMRRQMGLDQPLVVQYARYMESVFRGEFGRSFGTGNSVVQDLAQRIPATLELASFGIAFGVLVGIPLGLVAAVRRGKPTDHLVRVVNIAIQSVPAFWLGVVLIFLLYFQWRLVPSPIGRLSPMFISPPPVTGFLTIDALLAGKPDIAFAALRQLMLPALVLGLGVVSPLARITRSAMGESLGEDYVTFGRALGLRPRQVVLGDAFRGALVPIVTTLGFVVANVLAGAAIVETVFAWPGIGRYAVTAITTSDMAPVSTCILLIASSVAVTNLIVDLSYALIDPRIRHEYAR
ncbi:MULTISPECIES: ABC transporter permease [unclassified Devosia]|uniref:ABC transporter permease n=1 Tax=unclassified Devosia TaxID=196773 RepID=UPI00086A0BCF|nr:MULTISPECIES: ABC transporter permease [unclassified Devosia]MBN9364731.1 ABC transporter permease [Devosia sp.]ODS89800.1 MAG: peptide ABC transporter permease [Devosia sp. SCN 66-27]OJX25859.1 MAG: peptide ABC transporter permease [Devosia sp. 66-14]